MKPRRKLESELDAIVHDPRRSSDARLDAWEELRERQEDWEREWKPDERADEESARYEQEAER